MKRSVTIERRYPHPPARVWHALTDPEAIAGWLMPNDFEPRVGHRFTLRTDPAPGFDGIVRCQLLELKPPTRMVWSWRGGPIDTRVTFEVTPQGAAATRLRVVQSGFEGLKPVLVSFVLGAGSRKIYGERLPAVLDRLAAGRSPTADEPEEGCEQSGLPARLARLLAPVLGRRGGG